MMTQSAGDRNMSNPKISKNKFWYALYTKPKHEFKSAEYLRSLDLEYYLPTITTLKKWSDRKKKITEPLIRGYVFVFCNETERYQALQFDSIVSTVSFRGKPARIPDWQIENLKKLLDSDREIFVQDAIKIGTNVKITEGPFSGVTGIVCQSDDHGKMFGVTIDFIHRSVLVKLPGDSIVKEIEKE